MRQARIAPAADNPDFMDAIRTVLQGRPYYATVAMNGDEGVEKKKEAKPDLVLLDMIMLPKEGFTVYDQLKVDPAVASITVHMPTSLSQRMSGVTLARGHGLTLEAEEYIDKLVSPQEPLSRVRKQSSERGL